LYYNFVKALHLIFVITWFAGLFYVPRLFIYHIEGLKKPKNEADILTTQFKVMQKKTVVYHHLALCHFECFICSLVIGVDACMVGTALDAFKAFFCFFIDNLSP